MAPLFFAGAAIAGTAVQMYAARKASKQREAAFREKEAEIQRQILDLQTKYDFSSAQLARSGTNFRKKQLASVLSSGVALEGDIPLGLLEQTNRDLTLASQVQQMDFENQRAALQREAILTGKAASQEKKGRPLEQVGLFLQGASATGRAYYG